MTRQITLDEALQAFRIIYALIDEAFPEGQKYTATQLNIHPSYVKEMYELVRVKNE